MIYYNYDHATGAYLGTQGKAHECQLEEGCFHLPAWATYEIPPQEDGSTAYFEDGHWTLRKDPTPEEVVAELGARLTPTEKEHDMEAFVRSNIDIAARRLGFKDTQDALSYTGEETQRGYNADAFKTWRALAMEAVDKLVAKAVSTTEPLPTHQEWNDLFSGIPFERKIIPPPTVSPPLKTTEEYHADLEALIAEGSRVESLVK